VKLKPEPGNPSSSKRQVSPALAVVLGLSGVATVWFGSIFLVTATGELAQAWHVREWLVSLTLVGAVITLRGIVAAVLAARRGDPDLVFQTAFVGNAFVLLLGLGLRGVLSDKSLGISEGVLRLEIPLMGLFALLILPILLNGFRARRRDGIILLGAYVAFVVWEVSRAVK
jgi:cation:H+ antiporter